MTRNLLIMLNEDLAANFSVLKRKSIQHLYWMLALGHPVRIKKFQRFKLLSKAQIFRVFFYTFKAFLFSPWKLPAN